MRRIASLLVVIALAFPIAGCVNGKLITDISVKNPITPASLYDIENGYAIVLRGAVAYRERPLCKKNALESATNLCARRSIIVKLQAADIKAQYAISRAKIFITDNPNLDASSVLSLAREAVSAYTAIQSGAL